MTPSPRDPHPDRQAPPKKATLLQLARIVLSMLFMVGRNRDYAAAAPTIDPLRLIVVAVIAAALLIAGLVMLATYIAR